MPELPEVQTVITTLRPWLVDRRIVTVNLTRRDIITPPDVDLICLLSGRTVTDIGRRGKRIVITLDDANRFYIHLGMTGRLTVNDPTEPTAAHTHLTIDLSEHTTRSGALTSRGMGGSPMSSDPKDTGGPPVPPARSQQLRFSDPRRFGGIWWLGDAECDTGMGPEPLTLRSTQLARQLNRTTRAIKSALLDQSVIAGLGNIYVDESLFTARIHPLTPADRLSPAQISRLNRAIKSTLRKAINFRGSTLRDYRDADGTPGGFQKQHRVYDRAGKPCAVCKKPIERIVLGGRSTHFCPNCQHAR